MVKVVLRPDNVSGREFTTRPADDCADSRAYVAML